MDRMYLHCFRMIIRIFPGLNAEEDVQKFSKACESLCKAIKSVWDNMKEHTHMCNDHNGGLRPFYGRWVWSVVGQRFEHVQWSKYFRIPGRI